MNAPSLPDRTSRAAPNAPPHEGNAFSETLLAAHVTRASSVPGDGTFTAPPAPPSLFATLRALPTGIQGMWLGLACIVLLVCSAAALRSIAGGNVGAASPQLSPSASANTGPSANASNSAPSASVTAPLSAAPTGSSLSIGGGSGVGAFSGSGALAIRDRLSGHVRLHRYSAFLDDLERLIAVEPTAIDRPDVRKMIADVAMSSMVPGPAGAVSPEGQRLFAFLVGPAGAAGPDILFDLVTTRGGTRAATYAEDFLRKPEVAQKGTPALRIAWDLRAAPTCAERIALLPRAKKDGDRRALITFFQMAKCGKGPTDCCLANDPVYKDALLAVSAKK